MRRRRKREIPEKKKTCRPAASSGTMTTCENVPVGDRNRFAQVAGGSHYTTAAPNPLAGIQNSRSSNRRSTHECLGASMTSSAHATFEAQEKKKNSWNVNWTNQRNSDHVKLRQPFSPTKVSDANLDKGICLADSISSDRFIASCMVCGAARYNIHIGDDIYKEADCYDISCIGWTLFQRQMIYPHSRQSLVISHIQPDTWVNQNSRFTCVNSTISPRTRSHHDKPGNLGDDVRSRLNTLRLRAKGCVYIYWRQSVHCDYACRPTPSRDDPVRSSNISWPEETVHDVATRCEITVTGASYILPPSPELCLIARVWGTGISLQTINTQQLSSPDKGPWENMRGKVRSANRGSQRAGIGRGSSGRQEESPWGEGRLDLQ
ncbi:hypothetical protein PR048_007697 [Dryococelus australis]|uniref:Uncharacterized protein n=1 Tax=Dryococelus australis TaxID=614101 RepID=A0ABQ9HUZ2_9NEOP|nr:hypothetical protein PR048_007697 [Dryococelus australis]